MFSIIDVAEVLEGRIIGSKELSVFSFSSLLKGREGCLSFIRTSNDLKELSNSKSNIIVHNKDLSASYPEKTFIVVNEVNPHSINQLFKAYRFHKYGLDKRDNTSDIEGVFIGQNVKIGQNCLLMPGVKIMNGVEIGDNVSINSNTVIKEGTKIENNVVIDSNCSIGNFSFEYVWSGTNWIRLESVGEVIIEEEVEIGANNTIDRGTIDNTIIGKGTKIDNLIQIGHDTVIGQHCHIASQCGISGWVVVEDYVRMGGQVGIKNNVTIGRGSILQAKSGISKSVKSEAVMFGAPAIEAKKYLRREATLNKIIKLFNNSSNEGSDLKVDKGGFFKKIFG